MADQALELRLHRRCEPRRQIVAKCIDDLLRRVLDPYRRSDEGSERGKEQHEREDGEEPSIRKLGAQARRVIVAVLLEELPREPLDVVAIHTDKSTTRRLHCPPVSAEDFVQLRCILRWAPSVPMPNRSPPRSSGWTTGPRLRPRFTLAIVNVLVKTRMQGMDGIVSGDAAGVQVQLRRCHLAFLTSDQHWAVPIYLFASIRRGVSPQVNAIATVLLA